MTNAFSSRSNARGREIEKEKKKKRKSKIDPIETINNAIAISLNDNRCVTESEKSRFFGQAQKFTLQVLRWLLLFSFICTKTSEIGENQNIRLTERKIQI